LLKAVKRANAIGDVIMANAFLAQISQILNQVKQLRAEILNLLGKLRSQLEANEIWRNTSQRGGNNGQPPAGPGNWLFDKQIESINAQFEQLNAEVDELRT